MAELVSRRYALALFEVGLELGKTKEFDKELDLLKDVFNREEKFLQILKHPKIKKDEKKDILEKVFKNNVSREMLNFLYILLDKKRESYILEIIKEYKELLNEHENILKVIAITAIPMEEDSKLKLTQVISRKLNKKIELENQIDPNILGGVILKFKNKYIDGSIKGQLESIGRAIGIVS